MRVVRTVRHMSISNYCATADRAKAIKTKAVVNEDPTEKLLRDLKEENEKLKKQLASGKVDVADMVIITGETGGRGGGG